MKKDPRSKVCPDWVKNLNPKSICLAYADKRRVVNTTLHKQYLQTKYFDNKHKVKEQDFEVGDWVIRTQSEQARKIMLCKNVQDDELSYYNTLWFTSDPDFMIANVPRPSMCKSDFNV